MAKTIWGFGLPVSIGVYAVLAALVRKTMQAILTPAARKALRRTCGLVLLPLRWLAAAIVGLLAFGDEPRRKLSRGIGSVASEVGRAAGELEREVNGVRRAAGAAKEWAGWWEMLEDIRTD